MMDTRHVSRLALRMATLVAAGFYVAGGGCQPSPQAECQTDADCPEGQVCDNDQCVEPGCTTDDDCGTGEICTNGECVAGCRVNADCQPGEICTNGQCAAGCQSDEDCAEGDVCIDGQCAAGNPFEGALADFENNGPLHNLAEGGHFGQSCTACHHSSPDASGQACDSCHDRDEALFSEEFDTVVPILKDAMHAGRPDAEAGEKTACGACHLDTTEDGSWDCSQCHTEF